jgi:hypothetical protein
MNTNDANGTLMRCILPDKGCIILQDIHSGVCNSHAGAHMLVGKAYRQGFYWPMTIPTLTPWSAAVKGANFLLAKSTCHPINSKPNQSPRLFQPRGWIW